MNLSEINAIPTIQLNFYEGPNPKENHRPTLLFIHGLESSKETWFSVIPKLQDSYKVYAIDLRGHGESSLGVELQNLSICHFVADIDQFVREKNLHQFVLVSHSMGARVGIAYAAEYPGKVQHLVIEDMELTPRKPKQLSPEEILKLHQFNPLHKTLEGAQEELAKYGYSQEKFYAWLKQGRIKQLGDQKYFIGVSPSVSHFTHNACLASDTAQKSFKKFKEQQLPVLLIKADKESSVSAGGLAQMQKLLPTMEVVEIAQSHHSIHKAQPDHFIETLESYIKQSKIE